MSNLEIKINMLEALYGLANKGMSQTFRNFRRYVVNMNEGMKGLLEYNTYRNAIDKITSAALTFDDGKLAKAKEAIEAYKKIEDYLKDGRIFYGQ